MVIKNVPFSDLLKQELPEFANAVINIVEAHDPSKLKIEELFDRLVEEKASMKLLSQPYGINPINITLKPARKKCTMYARNLVGNMGLKLNENASNPTQALINANVLVIRYLHRMDLSRHEKLYLKRMDDFFEEYKSNEELQTTFETFELTKDCQNLKLAYMAVRNLVEQKIRSLSERPVLSSDEIAKPIIKTLKDMFMQIEVAAVKNSELDYSPLINELNVLIREQRNFISRRKLANKRKAAAREMAESNTESTNLSVTTTQMMHNPSVETMTGNGFEIKTEESLDEKKTAASSSKQLQLPPSENEG